jgi:hypothetical protein
MLNLREPNGVGERVILINVPIVWLQPPKKVTSSKGIESPPTVMEVQQVLGFETFKYFYLQYKLIYCECSLHIYIYIYAVSLVLSYLLYKLIYCECSLHICSLFSLKLYPSMDILIFAAWLINQFNYNQKSDLISCDPSSYN